MRALSYIRAEKITFPPKSDGQTDVFCAYLRLGQEGYNGTMHDYNLIRAIDIEGITPKVV